MRSVDGVGEETAQKLIDFREDHGGFQEERDLDEVRGMAETMMNKIKDQVDF